MFCLNFQRNAFFAHKSLLVFNLCKLTFPLVFKSTFEMEKLRFKFLNSIYFKSLNVSNSSCLIPYKKQITFYHQSFPVVNRRTTEESVIWLVKNE